VILNYSENLLGPEYIVKFDKKYNGFTTDSHSD